MQHSKARERTLPAARISATGYEWIETQAAQHRVSRSDVIREALAVAAKHPDDLAKRLGRLKAPREF